MEMPTPGPEHQRLATLAGSWTGEETLYPSIWDPVGGVARGTLESAMSLDGFFLVSDYMQQRGGAVSYRGHGIYGWDLRSRRYVNYWFDSMGDVPMKPSIGTWEGERLVFEHQSPHGFARYTHALEGAAVYRFRIDHSADGVTWLPFLEARYARRNPAD